MIKNIRLKKFLSSTIFNLFTWINQFIKHDEFSIMLYSNMGLRDNIGALFDYLIENKYYTKYQIICSLSNYKHYSQQSIPNVKFVSNLKGIYYFFICKHVYYCFGKLPIKPAKSQDVLQMWHGTPLKAGDKATQALNPEKDIYYTHLFAASTHFIPIMSRFFNGFPTEKIAVCGHPRTDILLKKNNENYNFGTYKKLITWAPTFRKSSTLGYEDSSQKSIVPIFNINELYELNKRLKELEIKIVVKLHPLQDLSQYKLLEMDHLILLSHQEFCKKEMDLYKLLKQSDALVTDYSSVFYDYLLLNRPIAFTADDAEEYGSNRGYAMNNPEDYKPGSIIKNKEDFYNFLNDFSNDIDIYKDKREKVKRLSNDYCDGNNCQRALELSNITK